jgi:hypothetical protein
MTEIYLFHLKSMRIIPNYQLPVVIFAGQHDRAERHPGVVFRPRGTGFRGVRVSLFHLCDGELSGDPSEPRAASDRTVAQAILSGRGLRAGRPHRTRRTRQL